MVAASEYTATPVIGQGLGVASMGSALVLERSLGVTGFRSFYFDSYPEHLEQYSSHVEAGQAGLQIHVTSDPRLQNFYVEVLTRSVRAMLRRERLTLDDFQVIFAPELKPEFLAQLAASLEVKETSMVTSGQGNLFTSGPAASWEAAQARGMRAGDLGLFLTVGPGIEVACASYAF